MTVNKEETGRKSRCLCCCCSRRQSSPSPGRDQNRNGTRLAHHSDNTPGSEKTANTLTFQHSSASKGSAEPTKQETAGQRCHTTFLKCCKQFLTFLFSNIGLCSVVVAYSILGGFIFQKLEAPNEIEKRHFVTSIRSKYAFDIWNLTQTLMILHEPNFTLLTEMILVDFQNELLEAKKTGWDGQDGRVDPQWSFAGSLLYSVTVITTIGYGHIAPKTFEGRLVTMFYAIIGIPLTLLCLANMGSFLGNSFRWLYMQLCRLCSCMCCPEKESFSKRRARNNMTKSKSQSLTPTGDMSHSMSQELDPLQIKVEENDSNTLKVIPLNTKKTRKPSTGTKSRSVSRSTSGTGSDVNIVIEDYDQPKEKITVKVEEIRVPIFVSLMIIAVYIFGGALMFSVWEGWDYLEGSYFCFITLSTIGFGDYVPGSISGAESEGSKEKLIICCVYLMFGLAVIAMCFNLMQEDVRAKFKWLGQKMGLIDRGQT